MHTQSASGPINAGLRLMLIYSCLCASPSTLTSFMEERSEEERQRTREERKEPGGPSLEREGMGVV